jgi:hypothetical protein
MAFSKKSRSKGQMERFADLYRKSRKKMYIILSIKKYTFNFLENKLQHYTY